MIAIIILLVLSWLLLRFTVGGSFSSIGIQPDQKILKHLVIGVLLSFIYAAGLYLSISLAVDNPYRFNPDYNLQDFFSSLFYVFKSVAIEELVFRGALLYILLQRFKPLPVILLSSVCFGIYHIINQGVSDIQKAVLVFFITGFVGYALAVCFKKTKSIIFPFAFHFGYNATVMILFSADRNIGKQLLLKTYSIDPVKPDPAIGITLLIAYYIGFPLLILLCTKKSPA